MHKLAEILELLKDGDFHSLAEISEGLEIPIGCMRAIVEFLVECGHASYKKENGSVKLKSDFLDLLS